MKKSKKTIKKRQVKAKSLKQSKATTSASIKGEQTQRKNFMSYNKAKQLIKKQKIKSKHQFEKWSSSKKRPDNFPSNPRSVYKLQWEDWSLFLSTGRKPGQRKDFMSYRQAQQFIKKQKVESKNHFEKWSSSKKRPDNFPSDPRSVYKEQWKNWGSFFGTGREWTQNKQFMSYNKAKQLIKKQKVKTKRQFESWSKSKKRPKDFPSNPNQSYKEKWKGWKNFLGS